MRPRVLFHVQHLLGIGHARRAALLARAMAAEMDVTVLAGGAPLPLDWGAGEIVQLPEARARDVEFRELVDAEGQPLDAQFHERRRELALAVLQRVRPHVLLIESFPFGRRAFRVELDALIAAARTQRAAVLVSLRDVLVAKRDPARSRAIVDYVRARVDAVLVHGDPALIPLTQSFPEAAEIADRLRYTGYVTEPLAPADGTEGSGEVIVSAGGGAVGLPLLAAALAARPRTALADAPWRLVAGPNLPMVDFAALEARLPPGVILERFRSDLPTLLARCRLSVSQGGYNTVLDLLQARARAVVVPFAAGAETEQRQRAEILAERGLLTMVEERELDRPQPGAGLAAAIARALATHLPPPPSIALDGARRSAQLVAEFARRAAPP